MFKVVKVIIEGEIPEKCLDCEFCEVQSYDPNNDLKFIYYDYCIVAWKDNHDRTKRPVWCPLVTLNNLLYELDWAGDD